MSTDFLEPMFKFFLALLNRKKAGDVFVKVAEIYDSMKHIMVETETVQQVLVIRAENNGGIIKPGCPTFFSIIYEDFMPPFESIRKKYQKVLIDGQYNAMLTKIYTEKHSYYELEQMEANKEEGLLKDIFKGEGIKYSEMHYLYHDKTSFFFMAMSTNMEGEFFEDAHDKMSIKLSVNKIRNIFNNVK